MDMSHLSNPTPGKNPSRRALALPTTHVNLVQYVDTLDRQTLTILTAGGEGGVLGVVRMAHMV